ncbi:hypothetical protein [Streptomyces sp. NPDC014995]|uniref:hypothetical protein n=1 Tax=Streptomyces sp. NPDC014995 TaxID=3364936 RepID=UPI0036FC5FA5
MRAQRARRLAAASAAGLMMAGGIAFGTAGTASASVTSQEYSHSHHCDDSWWDDHCDHDDNGRGGNGHHSDHDDNGRGGNGDHGDHDDNGRGGNGNHDDHDDNGRGGNGDHGDHDDNGKH